MNKLYTLMIAGSMLLAGALYSPAEARDHNNWRNNNRAYVNQNWNRAAVVRQQKGGPWVNAQIAADREYALRFSPQAQAAQNPYFNQYLNNQYANPYVNQYANPYYGNYNNYNGNAGLLNRILGRY